MFTDQVAPLLIKQFPPAEPFVCRTLRTVGLGESLVEEKIAGPLQRLVETGLDIGYCARPGEVDVRLTARGRDAEPTVAEAERVSRQLLGDLVFGVEEEELEAIVVRLLTARRQTVTLAESCTGGLIAHRLTNVPGASVVFLAGLVAYSNDAKESFIGVRAQTLAEHGAVSEAVAREMAEGIRTRTGADYAISVTGIAGPGGGTAAKPVGTVWIGLSSARGTAACHRVNPWDRETFKYVTSQQALDLLRYELSR
jgi:nicotinamide-nucleotide amidase